MMGQQQFAPKLFYQFSLDALVPETHLLRRVAEAVDFSFIRQLSRPYYSHTGQPSVDPVVLFKMLLVGYLYGITSERRLTQEVELHLAYRWFVGYDLDEAVPDHSVLSKGRAAWTGSLRGVLPALDRALSRGGAAERWTRLRRQHADPGSGLVGLHGPAGRSGTATVGQ